ncbi:MAG: hypothetical protein ACYSTS_16820 [Planctomycetota bacterium]|jgi:hypothetical protein
MVFKLLDVILGYLKDKPYWSRIQPICILVSLYLFTHVLAYQFIQWQYRISPSLSFYLSSYIFKQITLVFVTIGIIGFFSISQGKDKERTKQSKYRDFLRKHSSNFLRRASIVGLVLVIVVPIFLYFTPKKVSHISVKFLQEPDFDKYAFVYLIYELNKLQKNWYFEVDFDVFNENVLTTKERKRCAGENKSLCYSEMIANDQSFIGITSKKLGEDYFWQNSNKVSVISTYGWKEYAPPSVYEFLTHSIIVQSIMIHLNAHCKGLPKNSFKESRIAYGDLFQFSPRRQAMKSMILAAHLNRKGEELLFNCFGMEYMSICSQLLTLDWFHSQKVTENLEKCFNVKF